MPDRVVSLFCGSSGRPPLRLTIFLQHEDAFPKDFRGDVVPIWGSETDLLPARRASLFSEAPSRSVETLFARVFPSRN